MAGSGIFCVFCGFLEIDFRPRTRRKGLLRRNIRLDFDTGKDAGSRHELFAGLDLSTVAGRATLSQVYMREHLLPCRPYIVATRRHITTLDAREAMPWTCIGGDLAVTRPRSRTMRSSSCGRVGGRRHVRLQLLSRKT